MCVLQFGMAGESLDPCEDDDDLVLGDTVGIILQMLTKILQCCS